MEVRDASFEDYYMNSGLFLTIVLKEQGEGVFQDFFTCTACISGSKKSTSKKFINIKTLMYMYHKYKSMSIYFSSFKLIFTFLHHKICIPFLISIILFQVHSPQCLWWMPVLKH